MIHVFMYSIFFNIHVCNFCNFRMLVHCISIQNKNQQTLSQPKPCCNDSGELNLHHDNDVKEVGFVTTQCRVVHINRSENRNSNSVYES